MPVARAPDVDLGELDRCRAGDRDALQAMFEREAPGLEQRISRLVGPRADVEDLLQATFVEAIGSIARFRGEASVRTWLTRIAVHVVLHHLRHPRRISPASLELLSQVRDGAPPVDDTVDARHRLDRVYRHLEAIGPAQRIAFLLHVFEGRPIAEVAALVGATQVATRSRVFWARRKLLARARKDPALAELLAGAGGGS